MAAAVLKRLTAFASLTFGALYKRWRILLSITPGLLLLLVYLLPLYSDRLSLILAGYPFARIIPREKLADPTTYPGYTMRTEAIVFFHGNPIGWIHQNIIGLPQFEAYAPNSSDGFNTLKVSRFLNIERFWLTHPIHEWSGKGVALWGLVLAIGAAIRVKGRYIPHFSAGVATAMALASLPTAFLTVTADPPTLDGAVLFLSCLLIAGLGWIYLRERNPDVGLLHAILMFCIGLFLIFRGADLLMLPWWKRPHTPDGWYTLEGFYPSRDKIAFLLLFAGCTAAVCASGIFKQLSFRGNRSVAMAASIAMMLAAICGCRESIYVNYHLRGLKSVSNSPATNWNTKHRMKHEEALLRLDYLESRGFHLKNRNFNRENLKEFMQLADQTPFANRLWRVDHQTNDRVEVIAYVGDRLYWEGLVRKFDSAQ
jgi:hypothetical protein